MKQNSTEEHLSSPHCKIIKAILKIDKGGAKWNRENDKEIDDDTQGFLPER